MTFSDAKNPWGWFTAQVAVPVLERVGSPPKYNCEAPGRLRVWGSFHRLWVVLQMGVVKTTWRFNFWQISVNISKTVQNHLQTTGKNATYISNTIQNDLISSAGSVIRDKILTKVSHAKFFSLLVDKTTDLSKKEQMTVCLRYAQI